MFRKFYCALILAVLSAPVIAQVGAGTLKGTVTDSNTGELLPFVNVVVFLNGNQVTGGNTDFDGKYTIKPVDPGSYDVLFSYVGYASKQVSGVKITSNKITFLDQGLEAGIQLDEVTVVAYSTPLIDKDGGASGGTVSREDINKMPGRSATSIATTVAGVSDAGTGGGISIRGARSNSTWVYIDGIKVRGSSALPKSAVEEISVITGGIPANIGDATGGVINISLRSSSSKYSGGIELISSGFRTGETARGLDRYGYNLVEGSLSGPLLFKKDENGEKERPLLGFFVSGNYTDIVDPRPTHGGVYRMKQDSRQELLDNPLRQNISDNGDINGALFNADFLDENDFEKVPTRLNVGATSANLVAKIDVNTTKNMSLTFGATGAYNKANAFSYGNMLMNWENNLEATSFDWRIYGKFSQRFSAEEDEETSQASTLRNVFYSVLVDYSKNNARTQDDTHKDDFFKYGHVGNFDVLRENSYTLNDAGNLYEHDGFEDTLVVFTPSEFNPELAAINNQYFDLFEVTPLYLQGENDDQYNSLANVQTGNGLLNGQTIAGTYNLWTYQGNQGNAYGVVDNSQFRVSASGSADIGDHAVQLGFEYEQRKDRAFSIAPTGLWTLARLYANSHIKELDFDTGELTYPEGTIPYMTYDRLVGANQFEFDYNLRESLGLDPNGNDFINTDALDPDAFSLDMFGADDLLNQGNNLVNYYGFDHHGNKMNGRPTLEDFFNETNERGNYTRPVGAFEPIYMSGYIMDKFSFDDIIFNVGVRVDRFDANQQVLKDPYVVGQALSVSDVSEIGGNDVPHPSNIGDDFVVYVDDPANPANITGYRDGETWYNATGAEVENPALIASNNGFPTPLLVGGPDAPLTSDAFEDYDPQVNVMPRINFSFPISEEAVFFAHYDVLTQRPQSNNRFNPVDYLFLESRSSSLISNPNLKPTKTIDYELGFQQVLSKSSSLKISLFYRELRDMIQVRNFTGAYPRPYSAFGNLDFGTVKGLSLTYDLRRTGNIWIKGSYTLQFAEGTGSTTTTALALINAGLPNLRSISPFNYDQRHRFNVTMDYRYGEGSDYNGPILFDKQILKNTGINFIANLGSGTPYTAARNAYPVTGEISPSTDGDLNGSRLPWTFSMDMNIDRNFTLKFGEGETAKTTNLNIYLWVSNLLNSRNVNSVYRYTGVSDDDGYLAAAQYQANIETQNSPDSFRNYYSMSVDNPFNLNPPRTIRLGVRLDF